MKYPQYVCLASCQCMFKLYQSPCQDKRDQWLRSGIKGARHSANTLNYIMYKKLDDQDLWFDPRREHDFLLSKVPKQTVASKLHPV